MPFSSLFTTSMELSVEYSTTSHIKKYIKYVAAVYTVIRKSVS